MLDQFSVWSDVMEDQLSKVVIVSVLGLEALVWLPASDVDNGRGCECRWS